MKREKPSSYPTIFVTIFIILLGYSFAVSIIYFSQQNSYMPLVSYCDMWRNSAYVESSSNRVGMCFNNWEYKEMNHIYMKDLPNYEK